jgi:hypothetical protein
MDVNLLTDAFHSVKIPAIQTGPQSFEIEGKAVQVRGGVVYTKSMKARYDSFHQFLVWLMDDGIIEMDRKDMNKMEKYYYGKVKKDLGERLPATGELRICRYWFQVGEPLRENMRSG